jgi:hypothetical protein
LGKEVVEDMVTERPRNTFRVMAPAMKPIKKADDDTE